MGEKTLVTNVYSLKLNYVHDKINYYKIPLIRSSKMQSVNHFYLEISLIWNA